ncbi:MAG TPA: hypothetical protein VGN14_18810 [Candidatus Elarobacter sp.]
MASLRDELAAKLAQAPPTVAAVPHVDLVAAPPAAAPSTRPVAIVGVHGISPIQQYGFQDQLATGLLGYLNAVETAAKSGVEWVASPHWPQVGAGTKDAQLAPSALRLHRRDEPNPERPRSRVYDVFEGYWSPYTKDKTNIVSLLTWLLQATFLGTSSTARIPGNWRKLGWDLSYVLTALFLAVLFVAGAAVAANGAWSELLTLFPPPAGKPTDFFQFAFDPLHQLGALSRDAWIQLGADVVIAYLAAQLVTLWSARRATAKQTGELLNDSSTTGRFRAETIAAATFHRAAAVFFALLLIVVAGLDLWWLFDNHRDDVGRILWHAGGVVAFAFFFQWARRLADFVVLDVLGDIQVYTTHDANAAFFAIRQQVIAAVTNAVRGALSTVDPASVGEPLYERIHVAGHSLGSTVGLDVLIRLRQLCEENIIPNLDWSRLRSFTTFGTALEKTRFFFDVRNPTVSAAQQSFQNDVYGKYFTLDRDVLSQADNTAGIYWANYWYERDPVSNPIVSYVSDVAPGQAFSAWRSSTGAQPICDDNQLPHKRPIWAFVHGDYLGDALFWTEAGPIFTS